MAIERVWHGWTTPENADAYEELLQEEVFPGIEAKHIPGYRRIELWRHERRNEVEFITVMTFETLQNVIEFQGVNYERAKGHLSLPLVSRVAGPVRTRVGELNTLGRCGLTFVAWTVDTLGQNV